MYQSWNLSVNFLLENHEIQNTDGFKLKNWWNQMTRMKNELFQLNFYPATIRNYFKLPEDVTGKKHLIPELFIF